MKKSRGGTTTIATTMMTKCLAWLPSSGYGLVPPLNGATA
jgi:hypothetical protein